MTVVSRWIFDVAFAAPPQSGLAWFCFLFPLIEPDRRISRIRLSEKTHEGRCDAAGNFSTQHWGGQTHRTLSTRGSDGFVSSAAALIASGWSEPSSRAGLSPAVVQCLSTAHV